MLKRLQISYKAEQWHSGFEGSEDRWEVAIVTAAGTTAVPALTFVSDTSLPSGEITEGASTTISTTVSGLQIEVGEEFQIIFTAIAGTPRNAGSDDIFLNEFHYDNISTDTDEFIEIMVGPNFRGDLSAVEIALYNGGNGSRYATHRLSTFTLDSTELSGHRIYSKSISGIQNGSSDGIAIIYDGSVLEFLSYEGTLTAINGPASGVTSVNVGVSQSSVQQAGQASLGLTGSGSSPEDFTWTRFTGPFTQGSLNDGQTLEASVQSQGIAIDDLFITPLTAALELTSSITPELILNFPTEIGVNYEIQSSTDLESWSFFQSVIGTSGTVMIDVRSDAQKIFFRVGRQ